MLFELALIDDPDDPRLARALEPLVHERGAELQRVLFSVVEQRRHGNRSARALDLPHSSAWRLAYRLKRWGLVTVKKARTVGGKIFLVLRPRKIVIEIPDELLEQLQLGEGAR